MFLTKNFLKIFYLITIIIYSFCINFWTSLRGVSPIDTFLHFDSAFRILNGEIPVRDYWIVHGILIDYLQSFFFFIFGVNWFSYIFHSSILNVIVTLLFFNLGEKLELKGIYLFILTICFATISYSVSGTPFLDLHSTYFSFISIYFLIIFFQNNKNKNLFFSIFFLFLAFFCKQTPAIYVVFSAIFLIIYVSIIRKKIIIIFHGLIISFFFLLTFFLYLFFSNTDLSYFLLQFFLFPIEIAKSRYLNFDLNLQNVFFKFKSIYFFLLIFISINIYNFYIFKEYYKNKNFFNFITITLFSLALINHSIYTKNQIFIFFLIPLISLFIFLNLNKIEFKFKNLFFFFLIFFVIIITVKYHLRLNTDRKFHDLENTEIKEAIYVEFRKDFFLNLKWISPNFRNPKQEINIIEKFYSYLKKNNKNKILITSHNYFASLMNEKIFTISRTYDDISYPRINQKYYQQFQEFYKNKIKKNKIDYIYIFFPGEVLTSENLDHLVFNYIAKKCFFIKKIDQFIIELKLKKNCNEISIF